MPLAPHQLPWTGTGLIRVDADGFVKIFDPSTGQPVASFDSTRGVIATPQGPNGGDNISYGQVSVGQLGDIRSGTQAAPDTNPNPSFKFDRTVELTAGQIFGDGVDSASVIQVSVTNTLADIIQVVAVFGLASTRATSAIAPGPNADAVGIYGVGRSLAGSPHVGIGGFLDGRAEGVASLGSGLQVVVENRTGTDHTVAPTSGFSSTNAIWIVANGTNKAGIGIEFGNPFGVQFDVGIEFSSQVKNAKTGATVTADIQSDSAAATSILINGTHATAALAIAAGSGPLLVGGTAALAATSLLELQGAAASKRPLMIVGSQANQNNYSMYVRNSAGVAEYFVVAGVDNVLTGTIAGDTGVAVASANKFWHVGGTLSVIRVGNDNSLRIQGALATAAGGAQAMSFGSAPALGLYFGSGAPTVSAPQGSLYLRTDGASTATRAYINTNGTTGWTAVTTAA